MYKYQLCYGEQRTFLQPWGNSPGSCYWTHRKSVGSFQISWTISVRWNLGSYQAACADRCSLSQQSGGIHSNSRCLWNGNLGHVNSQNYSQSCGPALTDLSRALHWQLVGPDVKTRIIRTCRQSSQSLNSRQWPVTLVQSGPTHHWIICTAMSPLWISKNTPHHGNHRGQNCRKQNL